MGVWTTICNLKDFMWQEIYPATQLQMHGAKTEQSGLLQLR